MSFANNDKFEADANKPVQRAPEGDGGGVEQGLVQDGRVLHGAIRLPAEGEIPESLKVEVCQRVQSIRLRQQISIKALARQLGVSTTAVSEILRRNYMARDDEHIRRLNAWAESAERRLRSMRPKGICDTALLRLMRTGCDYAKSQGCIVVTSGPAGCGKSVAAQVYAAEDPSSIYVRLCSTHRTTVAFLRLVAEACRVNTAGCSAALMDRIVARVKGSHRLLIIDEWHQSTRRLYEVVRDLHDVAEIPIVLIATEEVLREVEAARLQRGATWGDQFASRVGWLVDLTRLTTETGEPRPLFTMQEVREIFRADQVRISADAIHFLQGLSCSIGLGCLRIASRCFAMAVRTASGREITAAHLRRCFRRLMVPEASADSALEMYVEEAMREIRRYGDAPTAAVAG